MPSGIQTIRCNLAIDTVRIQGDEYAVCKQGERGVQSMHEEHGALDKECEHADDDNGEVKIRDAGFL